MIKRIILIVVCFISLCFSVVSHVVKEYVGFQNSSILVLTNTCLLMQRTDDNIGSKGVMYINSDVLNNNPRTFFSNFVYDLNHLIYYLDLNHLYLKFHKPKVNHFCEAK